MKDLKPIISQFDITGTVNEVKPLGNGLINDTYKVTTVEDDAPDYVLQRINDSIFTDVDLLQHNIEEVTTHIRQQLENRALTISTARCSPSSRRATARPM